MVQFLSIIFFLDFFQFLLGFSKVPVFCVTCISRCVREFVFGLLWPILLLCVLKRFWCQLPKDGEITAPKHVGTT